MPRVLLFNACTGEGRQIVELLALNPRGDPLVSQLHAAFSTSSSASSSSSSSDSNTTDTSTGTNNSSANNSDIYVRTVDRTLPELACFPPPAVDMYRAHTDFRHGNTASDAFIDSCFQLDGSHAAARWDLVVLCSALKLEQPDHFSEQNVLRLCQRVAAAADRHRARQLVYISTYLALAADGRRKTEADPLGTFGSAVRFYVDAERHLLGRQAAPDAVPTVILRPGFCYGAGMVETECPILPVLALCKAHGEDFVFAGSLSQQLAVVHVADVARAALHTAIWHQRNGGGDDGNNSSSDGSSDGSSSADTSGAVRRVEVFNVSNGEHETWMHHTAVIAGEVGVAIKPLSALAELTAKAVTKLSAVSLSERFNSDAIVMWDELLRDTATKPSRVTPYIDAVRMAEHEKLSLDLDVTKLAAAGFVPLHPRNVSDHHRAVIDEWRSMGIWPLRD